MRYTTLLLSIIVLFSCSNDDEIKHHYEFDGVVNGEPIHWSTPEFSHQTFLLGIGADAPAVSAKTSSFTLIKKSDNQFYRRIYISTKPLEGNSIETFLTLREYEVGSEFSVQYEDGILEATNLVERSGTLKINSIATISEGLYRVSAKLNCILQTNQNDPSEIVIENASIVMELRTKYSSQRQERAATGR